MKFTSLTQKRLFCIDSGNPNLVFSISEDWEPDSDMVEEFIKKREPEIARLTNFRKSQSAKSAWRRNRYNYMSGIRDYHKSTKGKRMHKELGTFLATHDFNDTIYDSTTLSHIAEFDEELNKFCESEIRFNLTQSERVNLLKAISSVKTHLFAESEYYRDILEEVSFRTILDESRNLLDVSEGCLLSSEVKFPVSTLEFLCRVVDPSEMIRKYAILSDTDESKVQNRLSLIRGNLLENSITEETDGFYTILYNNLRHITLSKGKIV